MSAVLCPALLLLSPCIAWLLGDSRTLPAILVSVPDVFLLGMCAVYCGYCYGRENMRLPAVNECAEQTIRAVLCAALLLALPLQSVSVRAALPGVAESAAGAAVLVMFCRALPAKRIRLRDEPEIQREIWRLCTPMTLSRLCMTGMRALNAVLLPVCLRRSGLSAQAATAQFGLLSGMAMPLMMLPGIVTGAVCMVASPAVSRCEHQPCRLRRTIRQMSLWALGIGAAAMAGLFLLADVVAGKLYVTPELAAVIRVLCPLTLIMSLQQVLMGFVTGLGLQRKTLTGTIAGSVVTLVMTSWLCVLPSWRIFGASLAMLAGNLLRLIWSAAVVKRAVQHALEKNEKKFDLGVDK